jgi:hypothetical protein
MRIPFVRAMVELVTVRLALRLPENCPFCGTSGGIRLEQTIKGKAVVLKWCCQRCESDWPVTPDEEQIDRRLGPDDRRAVPRKDRRNR